MNTHYNYFVAGRMRNKTDIREAVVTLRQAGKSTYYFIENAYDVHGIHFGGTVDSDTESEREMMEAVEDWKTNETLHKIFKSDTKVLQTFD